MMVVLFERLLMDSSIRAEVRVPHPSDCLVASVSARTGAASRSVSKSVNPQSPEVVTEEFEITHDADLDSANGEITDVDEVFSYDSTDVYRFSRPIKQSCPCECIEEFDCPVTGVYAETGDLHLTFHVVNTSQLQTIVSRLQENYTGVEVKRLLQSDPEDDESQLVMLDRDELTDRQEEVLKTAHEMGYFEHPKDSNAGDVAEKLGITTATFTEHLAAAQRKIFRSVVE